MNKKTTVQDMVLVAVFAALIVICSLIQIPLAIIPFSLQTFAVFTTAGLLGAKRSMIAVIIYILMGLVGLPVFTGKGGPGVIVGPTGGYIFGFIFMVLVIGFMMKAFRNATIRVQFIATAFAMLVGDIICFAIGTMQFMFITGNDFKATLGYCVFPFIVPDLIKIFLATIVVTKIKKCVRVFN